MIKTMLLSSLAKVFTDEEPKNPQIKKFSLLKNERRSFQIAFCCEADTAINFSLESPLKEAVSAFFVELIPSKLPKYEDSDDFFLRGGKPGLYPDLLRPAEGALSVKKGEWRSLWFELDPKSEFEAGVYDIKISINGVEECLKAEIIDAILPEQDLICTMWYHTDCLMNWYKIEAFSEEYWRIVEEYAVCAVRHGVNFLLTPLFTPPLDTWPGTERPTVQLVDVEKIGYKYKFGFEKLKRWVEMCDRIGIKYFEMSHLFTQWGAEHAPKIMAMHKGEYKLIFGWDTNAASQGYKSFLTQFAAALIAFIDENGIRERCIFHTSDEPGMKHYYSYRRAAKITNELFGEFKIIDALSDYAFYEKGMVKTPIPANSHIEDFIGRVPELWTYYCCGQHRDNVSNRFFAMPSQRNRILGWQMYKYDVKGFLQWGFNYWFSQFSKREINPFEESDAGEAFGSGDAYVVYPGDDGIPLVSLRFKVFYDAIQDMLALKLLESRLGKKKVIEIIENNTKEPLTFSHYPHEEEWLINKREEINEAIKNKSR